MKKSTIIIFVLLAVLKTQAQNYLINFAGWGDTTMVATVKVDNLTSGATVTLNGSDILHLVPTLGIGSRDADNGMLTIAPNPMKDRSVLTFVAPVSGNAVICILDLSGKIVCQINTMLSYGAQSFSVSGISQGMYFVKVTGKNYNYSAKLISQSSLPGEAKVGYVSAVNITTGNHLKNSTAIIDMLYSDGDQLLYTSISGRYSTIVTDMPENSKTINFHFLLCTDNDGQNYPIVEIGAQAWMAKNLNVGVRVNGTQSQLNNGIIEKYCYDDKDSNCNIYGGLYQWNEMMQYDTMEGIRGICPAGWHLASDAEWRTLTGYLGGDNLVVGGKLKSTGTIQSGNGLWWGDNTGATNSSGFTVFPGGYRAGAGYFTLLSQSASFWTSSHFLSGTTIWVSAPDLGWDNARIDRYWNAIESGFSVRCLKKLKWY